MKRLALALLLLAALPAQAQSVLNRGNGAEPDSLDPAQAGSVMETNILGDMMVGLTTLDAAARPIPGIAERWEVSADGLIWTFHLRKARWSDGRPVTADNFVSAWRRLLDPKTAARGAQLLWVIQNARAVTAGKKPVTELGVTAANPSLLKIRLEHPAPYLPELLTLPAALPLPPNPSFKPGAYISNGPYLLKAWQPNDHITLAKNPAFYDAGTVKIDIVNYFPTSDSQAAEVPRYEVGNSSVERARTTTPRATAASSAFSSSTRSNRKMTMSMVFFARAIASTTGATPSSGWMISFTSTWASSRSTPPRRALRDRA